jgi:hypothetical protein
VKYKERWFISSVTSITMNFSPSPELVPDCFICTFNFNGVIHPLPVLPTSQIKQTFFKFDMKQKRLYIQDLEQRIKKLQKYHECRQTLVVVL